MCVAIYKPAGSVIEYDELEQAHLQNFDGCGLAGRTSAGVGIARGLWSFDTFLDCYKQYEHKELLIHFRLATMGVLSEQNCHPIPFDGHAMVHNGHFFDYGDTINSDTVAWVHNVLQPLMRQIPNALDSSVLRALLEGQLDGSLVAIMHRSHGEVTILNEKLGIWDTNGVWYSNILHRYWSKSLYEDSAYEQDMMRDSWQDTQLNLDYIPKRDRINDTF